MGPIVPLFNISNEINLLMAFIIGLGFGFVLEQAGFSSSRKLAGMFYGYDITVLKVFFTAAITGMLGLIFLNFMGLIDLDIVYINEYYVTSSIIGGVIMGAGFIIGGFCPGTSFTAAAIGKIDAMWFVFGSIVGIFIFGEVYPLLETMYMSNYEGSVKISTILGIRDGYFALLLIVVASLMFWIGEIAEKKFKREDIIDEI
ncbi:MAG: YeeE/YedE family protein [Cyclobacteriaceae bacterium]|nr:YeeE/YedE family protein [Cyclobacteriaceae bacterium]